MKIIKGKVQKWEYIAEEDEDDEEDRLRSVFGDVGKLPGGISNGYFVDFERKSSYPFTRFFEGVFHDPIKMVISGIGKIMEGRRKIMKSQSKMEVMGAHDQDGGRSVTKVMKSQLKEKMEVMGAHDQDGGQSVCAEPMLA
ncbi:unnamed protein product [Dovyalis caffra]|uniref:Uncharacterized protein n=1 Tax=Dovyalis caffra TaxID=77055 RepID=A0AAV1SIA6_9ROSI|nr:unnamed protein product [Dovyalis caffra]